MIATDMMIKDPEAIIQEAKKRLIQAYDPLAIYLYGEYVYRLPDKYSQLNFAVILPDTDVDFFERPDKGHEVLFEMDPPNQVVVWTKKEFDEIVKVRSSSVYEVAHEGRKIYEKESVKS